MSEFLLELFSEEIPARMQSNAQENLERLLKKELGEKGLTFEELLTHVTPRRLVACIKGLPPKQADQVIEKKGPRIDAPQKAIQGFLEGHSVSLAQCEERDLGKKGTFLFVKQAQVGQETKVVLQEVIQHVLAQMPWPKKMRWGEDKFEWVRPLKRMNALFNGELIRFQAPHSGIEMSGYTEGHRFLSMHPFKIKNFAQYKGDLHDAYVMLDEKERQDKIRHDMTRIAEKQGLHIRIDEGLLNEVVGLVEWPVVLLGQFDERYLRLPKEVLITTMAVHQKYFPLFEAPGHIAPYFIIVANMETTDTGASIIQGNERVLNARFADADFYWEKDLKKSFDAWNAQLKEQVFYADLGSVLDKVQRVEKLCSILAPQNKHLVQAAKYFKADLASGVVLEFPELQGIMGSYYAKHQGFATEVVTALRDYYLPKGSDDALPKDDTSILLALADRIDTIVSFFSVGVYPTGSKDPYALRRNALGIIRLVLEKNLPVDLRTVIKAAYKNVMAQKQAQDVVYEKVKAFIRDRFEVFLVSQGLRQDIVRAAMPLFDNFGSLVGVKQLALHLQDYLLKDEGIQLVQAYKRAANIVGQVERKEKKNYTPLSDSHGGLLPEEYAIFQTVGNIEGILQQQMQETVPSYEKIVSALASLYQPLETFFERITVMDEDEGKRVTRLRLLASVRDVFNRMTYFEALQG